MKRSRILAFVAILLPIAALWIGNTNMLVEHTPGDLKVLSHRGVHHDFDRRDLENDTCTATRIFPPRRPEIENTLESMRAAFDMGASVVELDIHPTSDGHFAVFHDWTLECRTNGEGRTRDRSMIELKALDVGYGYTADEGKTYPLRGTGIGKMPTFEEVVSAFPDGRFLVNFKSNDPKEGRLFAQRVASEKRWKDVVWGIYGGDAPTQAYLSEHGRTLSTSKGRTVSCLGRYILTGWSGYVPETCRLGLVMVPIDVAPWLWGWPYRFQERMRSVESVVVLRGPQFGSQADDGVDSADVAAKIPDGFSGYVFTNSPELFSPL